MIKFVPLVLGLLTVGCATVSPTAVRPLPQAHAHNDYEHQRPLFDALEQGFCSVEADVWLVNGQLLVAHDLKDARPERTLEKLYLAPLTSRVAQNGGRVFRDGPPLTLLVDIKSDATNTYLALRPILQRYAAILTKFHRDRTETNAVTVILSGNRPRGLLTAESSRLAAYDGRLNDLQSEDSPHLIPLVSDNWSRHFTWRGGAGDGPLPDAERRKLKDHVQNAHQQGRRIRWWGAPDNAAGWKVMADESVDLINTDNLPGLRSFLTTGGRQ